MTQENNQQPKRTPAEWLTFSIASSILAGIVGLVGFTWYKQPPQQPPILVVTNQKPMHVNGEYYVPFEIINKGGQTVASVQIIAQLQLNGIEETGEQQIDFLSRDEKENGAFIFTRNPQEGKLIVRVSSYKLP